MAECDGSHLNESTSWIPYHLVTKQEVHSESTSPTAPFLIFKTEIWMSTKILHLTAKIHRIQLCTFYNLVGRRERIYKNSYKQKPQLWSWHYNQALICSFTNIHSSEEAFVRFWNLAMICWHSSKRVCSNVGQLTCFTPLVWVRAVLRLCAGKVEIRTISQHKFSLRKISFSVRNGQSLDHKMHWGNSDENIVIQL